jgi:hypothetical protein
MHRRGDRRGVLGDRGPSPAEARRAARGFASRSSSSRSRPQREARGEGPEEREGAQRGAPQQGRVGPRGGAQGEGPEGHQGARRAGAQGLRARGEEQRREHGGHRAGRERGDVAQKGDLARSGRRRREVRRQGHRGHRGQGAPRGLVGVIVPVALGVVARHEPPADARRGVDAQRLLLDHGAGEGEAGVLVPAAALKEPRVGGEEGHGQDADPGVTPSDHRGGRRSLHVSRSVTAARPKRKRYVAGVFFRRGVGAGAGVSAAGGTRWATGRGGRSSSSLATRFAMKIAASSF